MPLCPYCGNENREGAAFCTSCRRTIAAEEWLRPRPAPPPPIGAQPWDTPYYDRAIYSQPLYTLAAFWPRFGAWVLDILFAALLALVPAVMIGAGLAFLVNSAQDEPGTVFEEDQQQEDVVVAAVIGGMLGYGGAYLAYFTVANGRGGGWGKRIMGLRIIRQRDGQTAGYGSGFIRALIPVLFWLFISVLWLLDHLWCVWDSQKQCWHDKVAGTLVVVTR
jgi:uncharacterized RDD family membrane protein YckC